MPPMQATATSETPDEQLQVGLVCPVLHRTRSTTPPEQDGLRVCTGPDRSGGVVCP